MSIVVVVVATHVVLCVIVINVVLYADLRLCRSNGFVYFHWFSNSNQLSFSLSLSVLSFCIDTAVKFTNRITEWIDVSVSAQTTVFKYKYIYRIQSLILNTKKSDVMRVNGSIIAHLKEIENGTE